MKAIILAAGRGSRLGGFTETIPKCLNKIGNITILEWILSSLKASGINDIVIVGGYKADMLKDYGTRIIYNSHWETTNMVGSLLCARREFNEPVIISYSDIVYSGDVAARLQAKNKDIVVSYDTKWKELWKARFGNPLIDAESFKIDSESRITDIGSAVDNLEGIQGQFMGLMYFTPVAFSWVESYVNNKDMSRMDMTTLLRGLIHNGRIVSGVPISGGWIEIDRAKDLELANQFYDKGLLKFK